MPWGRQCTQNRAIGIRAVRQMAPRWAARVSHRMSGWRARWMLAGDIFIRPLLPAPEDERVDVWTLCAMSIAVEALPLMYQITGHYPMVVSVGRGR
jgi:hypothetical protein